MRVPVLPVLDAENRSSHPDWHAYFERVYGHPVFERVDLNRFSFFYNDSPLKLWPGKFMPDVDEAVKWPMFTPGAWIARTGFFVRRAELGYTGPVMEVMRARYRAVDSLMLCERETRVHWFYEARGSGVFVRLPEATLVLKDREEWPHGKWLHDGQSYLERELERASLRAVVLTHSIGGVFPPPYERFFGIPRTEVIVRLPDDDATCCASRLDFYAGWAGSRRCAPNLACVALNSGVCPAAKTAMVTPLLCLAALTILVTHSALHRRQRQGECDQS